MFAAKYPIDDELALLWEHSNEKSRADLIKYEAIESLTGLKRRTAPFEKLIKHWKRKMRVERRIAVHAEPNVGYVLLTESQQLDYAESISRRSPRAMRLAAEIAGVIDPEKLDAVGQARQQHMVSSLKDMLQRVAEQRVERKAIVAKTESLPRMHA